MVPWKFVGIRDLFIVKPIGDFLLEDHQLVFHLWVDVPLGVWDGLAQSCVADLVPIIGVLHLDNRLPLWKPVYKLNSVVAVFDHVIVKELLPTLLAGCPRESFLSVILLYLRWCESHLCFLWLPCRKLEH